LHGPEKLDEVDLKYGIFWFGFGDWIKAMMGFLEGRVSMLDL